MISCFPEKEYFEGGGVMFLPIKYVEEAMDPDIFPKNFLPFADYNEGSLCISLNKDDYEKIYFVDESGEIEPVADSFDEFMNRLTDDPDD